MAYKDVAVLGLGIFGSTLAETLSNYDVEVLAVDRNPVNVERIADSVTSAVVADITDKEQLLEIGIDSFDAVVVAMSQHFEDTVLCTMILKEIGVKEIIVKAQTKRKSTILKRVGATQVINVEKDMAIRISKQFLRNSIVDLIEIDEEYAIVEIKAPRNWVGKTLQVLNVRAAFKMNIIGIRHQEESKMSMDFTADYVVKKDDVFIVAGRSKDMEDWDNRQRD